MHTSNITVGNVGRKVPLAVKTDVVFPNVRLILDPVNQALGGTLPLLTSPIGATSKVNMEDTPMDNSNSTLVTFELSPTASGTQLRVIETGFLQLRPELQDISYRENTSGWEHELAELVAFMSEI